MSALEPVLFVGECDEWFIREETTDVFEKCFEVSFRDSGGGSGDVGRDDDVFHTPEGVILWEWFNFEDIQGGSRDLVVL